MQAAHAGSHVYGLKATRIALAAERELASGPHAASEGARHRWRVDDRHERRLRPIVLRATLRKMALLSPDAPLAVASAPSENTVMPAVSSASLRASDNEVSSA